MAIAMYGEWVALKPTIISNPVNATYSPQPKSHCYERQLHLR